MNTASTYEGAQEALNRAFDRLDNGDMNGAAAWADIAAETIRAAALTLEEQAALVAPEDGPNNGDVTVILIANLILLWIVADTVLGWMQ